MTSRKVFSFFLVLNLSFFNLAPALALAFEDGGSPPPPEASAGEGGDGGIVETGDALGTGTTENTVNSSVVSNDEKTPLEEDEELNSTQSVEEPPSNGTIPEGGSENGTTTPLTPEGDGTQEEGYGDFLIQGSGYDGSPVVNSASSTQLQAESENGNGDGGPVSAEIENESEAVIENDTQSEANTGENSADGGNATSTGNGGDGGIVLTGNAHAAANIVNVANTNIIDATGFFMLLNGFGNLLGDFDFRNLNFTPGCPGNCSFFGPDSELSVSNKNSAEITNDVVVRANSGGNTVNGGSASGSGNGGDGGIVVTGDAFAGANVLNVVNTNIVGSNYLLFAFNNFGDFAGDLVFPSKYFFEEFLKNKCCKNKDTKVKNDNSAEVLNNVSAEAETGENETEGGKGGEGGVVITGDANSNSNVSNTVNSNLFGDDTFVLVVRVFGGWLGNVFGAPDHIKWKETKEGLVVYDDSEEENSEDGDGSGGGSLLVENQNNASVKNNVQVLALTGANNANGGGSGTGDGGDGGIIATGDAAAGANVVNVVNTNIVGRNWILAFVNIFGNWEGNVAFGKPDLWVGERVLVPGDSDGPEIVPGSILTYTITVVNKGDADATKTTLKDKFASKFLEMKTSGGGYYEGEDEVWWNLGTIKPGEVKEITYQAAIRPQLPFPATHLINTATVWSFEEDENPEDNTETTVVELNRRVVPLSEGAGDGSSFPRDPVLNIEKTNSATTTVKAGGSVDYTVRLKNNGFGSAYDVEVLDTLSFVKSTSSIEAIDTQVWNLGEVLPGEEVVITYTVEISPEAPPGLYKNVVEASGRSQKGFEVFAPRVSSLIEIEASEKDDDLSSDGISGSGGFFSGGLGVSTSSLATTTFPLIPVLPPLASAEETGKIIKEASAAIEPAGRTLPLASAKDSKKSKNQLASLLASGADILPLLSAGLLGLFLILLAKRERKEDKDSK